MNNLGKVILMWVVFIALLIFSFSSPAITGFFEKLDQKIGWADEK